MKKKLLFFDIDGTLVGFDGKMPASTADALQRASKNGHKLYICTGRSRPQVYPWLLRDHPFDGLVMSAGANVYAEGKQISRKTFGPDRIRALIDFLDRECASWFLQGENGCWMTEASLIAQESFIKNAFGEIFRETGDLRKTFQKLMGTLIIDDSIALEPEKYGEVETAVYNGSSLTVKEMQDKFAPLGIHVTETSVTRPDPYDGEVTVLGVTKREGMMAVEKFYGLTREDTVAFGDGYNDIEMLTYAGTGVCMGDGAPAAREAADMITRPLAEDGIFLAMKEIGLI